jgi:hypothetical protein
LCTDFGEFSTFLVVESVYENVKRHPMEQRELLAGECEENVVLQFKPEPAQTMYIALSLVSLDGSVSLKIASCKLYYGLKFRSHWFGSWSDEAMHAG